MKAFFLSLLLLLSLIIHAQNYSLNSFNSTSMLFSNQPITGIDKTPWYKPPVYIMSIMGVNLGFLVVSGMADDKIRFSNFKRAFNSAPVFDDDAFWINYISHPLMGSESYLRGREAGYGWFGSFLFSSGMSLTWEYLIESWTEQPSINDMLVTSSIGSLMGELRYRAKAKMKPEYHWFIDPINTLVIRICPKQKAASISLSFYLP